MGENNRPAGWGQNKNIPDSWGKGGSVSPWGEKQDKPAGWGSDIKPESPVIKTEVTEAAAKPISSEKDTPQVSEVIEPVSALSDSTAEYTDRSVQSVDNGESEEPLIASEANKVSDTIEAELAASTSNAASSQVTVNNTQEKSSSNPVISAPAVPPPNTSQPEYQQSQIRQPAPQPVYRAPFQGNSDYGYMQYSQSAPAKSRIVIVFGGIIAVLLLVLGLFIGKFVLRKDDNNNNDNAVPAAANDAVTSLLTSTAIQEEMPLSSADTLATSTVATTTTTTVSNTESTAVSTTVYHKADTSNAAKTAVISSLNTQYANNSKYFDNEMNIKYYNELVGNAQYALYDLDYDGTDELFITYPSNGDSGYYTEFYKYENGNYVKVNNYAYVSINLSEHLFREDVLGGGHGTKVYTFADNTLAVKDLLDLMPTGYSHNGAAISQGEYERLLSQYDNNSWIRIPQSSLPVSRIVDINSFLVTFDEYNDTSNLIAIGKVTTQSTSLNMRETPSTSADIITQIPNDAYLGIVSTSGDWYYVKYYKDTSSPIYYGYVHREYITITEWL